MLIIGGGPEGVEFAQIFQRFGVKVTVLQRRDRILPREDEEISRELEALLRAEGLDIRTRATPTRVGSLSDGRLVVMADVEGREERFEVGRILVAAGRRPHRVGELGLDEAGIAGDLVHGIVIDEHLQTTNPAVWAIGDVVGRMQHPERWIPFRPVSVSTRRSPKGLRQPRLP